MGIPVSHGCIRMRNQDILELFELILIKSAGLYFRTQTGFK